MANSQSARMVCSTATLSGHESLPAALPDPQTEAAAFWQMRRCLMLTGLRQLLSQSRFRASLVALLSAALWLGLFWLFTDGFVFLKSAIPDPDTHDETVRAVFGMFFAALLVMLVFSSGIILYSSLFRSPDISLLMTLPARDERVFLHKFQETVLLSSWAFLLLGSPMLLAYGMVASVPTYYYLLLLPFLISFIYIPAGIGAVMCLVIVRWFPGRRVHLLAVGAATVILAVVWYGWSIATGPESNLLTPDWFREMLGRMRLTQRQLLPSWWLSSGLLEAARREWSESVLFLTLMISNALFCRQLSIWSAGRLFREAYSGLSRKRRSRKRKAIRRVDRFIERVLPMPLEMRILLVKDLRLFRRDPVQWSQFLIFFGLLALYFLNIRRFSYDVHYVGWVNMVSFLNLSVVGLILSTFTTRFIFPMISLEGQRFWILGLLPLNRDTILWSKFFFAAGGAIAPCSALIFLSDAMLRVSGEVIAIHQLICVLLCVGLSGIAVGLGAKMPNLREPSPSRIAAGFGGTLNLVLSAAYIISIVVLTALPSHFFLAAKQTQTARIIAARVDLNWWLDAWLVLGTLGSVVLGIVATLVPMRIGIRAFREMEF